VDVDEHGIGRLAGHRFVDVQQVVALAVGVVGDVLFGLAMTAGGDLSGRASGRQRSGLEHVFQNVPPEFIDQPVFVQRCHGLKDLQGQHDAYSLTNGGVNHVCEGACTPIVPEAVDSFLEKGANIAGAVKVEDAMVGKGEVNPSACTILKK
jgi:hypothetical protein